MKILVVDIPNLFFRVVAAHNTKFGGDEEDKAGLALHSCLNTMNKWYTKVQPDKIIVVFEGSNNWRKTYTKSPECKSGVIYKGNRVKDPSMEHLFQVITDFETLARNHTSIVCLSADTLEGDDLIAGCAQYFSKEGHEVIILSGDKDFMQLLKLDNVKLLNPDKGEFRECDNPEYFIFEKCIRGDTGDNVRSAFPRVRSKRLEKAYQDQYEMVSLMNETWSITDNEKEKKFSVKELFEENQLLMDLEKQPDDIRDLIFSTINDGIEKRGKFSMFAFQKFVGQHGLKQIGENVNKFIKLLSCDNKPTVKSSILKF